MEAADATVVIPVEETQFPLLQQQHPGVVRLPSYAKVGIIVQSVFLTIFTSLTILTLVLAPPWKNEDACSLDQRLWPTVWCLFMVTHGLFMLLHTLVVVRTQRPSPVTFAVHRVIRVLCTIWFISGMNPLFWKPPCDAPCRSIGRALWYLHGVFYLIPLAMYLLLCLCFPCLLLALARVRPPGPNEQPTPPEVMSKVTRMTFEDLVALRRDRFHHVQDSAFAGESYIRNNPIVAATIAATNAAVSATSTTSPAGDAALRLERVCPICMSDFDDADTVMVMPCDLRHYFHEDCVKEWLAHSQRCPICRANVVELLTTTTTTTSA